MVIQDRSNRGSKRSALERLGPFWRTGGSPVLCDSIALFADILGSKAMALGLDAQANLERLDRALKHASQKVTGNPFFRSAAFSDNLVAGWPLQPEPWDSESSLGSALMYAAYYQFDMTQHGFFIRGGLARGQLYMDEGLTFGPALVEAYEIERNVSLYPRIVLSKAVIQMARGHLSSYGSPSFSPHDELIAWSPDGRFFLNYLSVALDVEVNGEALLSAHRQSIVANLRIHAPNPRIHEKYEWLAGYHNYFCSTYFPSLGQLQVDNFEPLHLRSFTQRVRKKKRSPEDFLKKVTHRS